jgi:hypothetical protein
VRLCSHQHRQSEEASVPQTPWKDVTYNNGNFAVGGNKGRCYEGNEKDIDEHF